MKSGKISLAQSVGMMTTKTCFSSAMAAIHTTILIAWAWTMYHWATGSAIHARPIVLSKVSCQLRQVVHVQHADHTTQLTDERAASNNVSETPIKLLHLAGPASGNKSGTDSISISIFPSTKQVIQPPWTEHSELFPTMGD